MFGSKERPYSGRVLISFWRDYDNKNFNFFLECKRIGLHHFCSFWLFSKFDNLANQLKFKCDVWWGIFF